MMVGAAFEMNHIPILRTYVRSTMKMLNDVKDTRVVDREAQYKIRSVNRHKLSQDTLTFFEERYGMDPLPLEEELRRRLNVSTLTTMIDWEPIDTFVAVDN
jgi:hypothetical protein